MCKLFYLESIIEFIFKIDGDILHFGHCFLCELVEINAHTFFKINNLSCGFVCPGLIESRILSWFRRASSTVVANVTIDAIAHLDEFEVSLCMVNQ